MSIGFETNAGNTFGGDGWCTYEIRVAEFMQSDAISETMMSLKEEPRLSKNPKIAKRKGG